MKLTIKTSKLQEMTSKAVKGSSGNKLIPLTSLMSIELENHKLTMTTTDATNYLYVVSDNIDGDDFYVTVAVETFAKLISKLTCEYVELELLDSGLKVKGNGQYLIELPTDEEGNVIKYPNPLEKFVKDETTSLGEINANTVQSILNSVKPSLATTLEVPCYTGYYMGKKVIGTDTYKVSALNIELFKEPKLISAGTMDLLDVFTSESIKVDGKDNIIVFSSPDCVVYGRTLEGIENYQVNAIEGLLNMGFHSMCKLSKQAILQLLDRLALFVNVYDKNGIYLEFTKEGLLVNSKSASGKELIPYLEEENFQAFNCVIDIQMLYQQIKSHVGNTIELWYGEPNVIKLVNENITQIIALLEDDINGGE